MVAALFPGGAFLKVYCLYFFLDSRFLRVYLAFSMTDLVFPVYLWDYVQI